jgi:predicted RNase H-like nuclease (RuvC/YqgF family)
MAMKKAPRASHTNERLLCLRATIRSLRAELAAREREAGYFVLKHSQIVGKLRSRAEMNETLRRAVADDSRQLEAMFLLAASGWMPVLVADRCGSNEMNALETKYGLHDKWVVILSDDEYSGTDTMRMARGVICTGRLFAIAASKGVPAINRDAAGLERCGDLGVIYIDHKKIEARKREEFGAQAKK